MKWKKLRRGSWQDLAIDLKGLLKLGRFFEIGFFSSSKAGKLMEFLEEQFVRYGNPLYSCK